MTSPDTNEAGKCACDNCGHDEKGCKRDGCGHFRSVEFYKTPPRSKEEKPYGFVTTEEVAKAANYFQMRGFPEYAEKVLALLAERDAFREVAIQQSLGRLVGPDEVDDEAKRFLSEQKGEPDALPRLPKSQMP